MGILKNGTDKRWLPVSSFLVVLIHCAGAIAQQPSLEELQKRLDAAKQAQQQRDAAQKAEAARRASQQRAEEAEQRAQAVQSGRVVVEADAACELKINGERKQMLRVREPATVAVLPGEQLIDCQSIDDRGVSVREVRKVERGGQMVVMLSLAASVARAKDLCQGGRGPMVDIGQGVIRQCATGLEWTQSDNGSNINWHDAVRYCQSRGGGWRSPLASELQAIVDQSGTLTTGCGSYKGGPQTCNVSPSFRLTDNFMWSSEREGSSRAWLVHLTHGTRSADDVGVSYGRRALCVRRP